jgi:hypothetical protein
VTAFTDPGYVAVCLNGVLQALADGLAGAARPANRVVRSAGPPALDCSLLAVWGAVRQVAQGTRQDLNPMMRQVRLALDVEILLARCLQAAGFDDVPPATAVDADGAAAATDTWIITRTLTDGVQTATLGLPGGCMVARLNPVTAGTPTGGLYTVTTTLEVVLG